MTDLKEGTYVRHRAKPEWGLGVVEQLSDVDLHIRFEAHPTANSLLNNA